MSQELQDPDLLVINAALRSFAEKEPVAMHAYQAVYGPGLLRLQGYVEALHTAKNRIIELENPQAVKNGG